MANIPNIPINSRSYGGPNNEEKVFKPNPPSLSNSVDKFLLTVIYVLLAGSTVILPALAFFGTVNNKFITFDVYRMYVQDTTTYHDIPDVYPIGLWNYCYGFADLSTSEWLCTKMKYGFYLNPYNIFYVQTNSLPDGEQIQFTNSQTINLDWTPFTPSTWNFLPFILLHVSFVFGSILFILWCYRGIRRLFSKGQHGYSVFQGYLSSELVALSILNAASAALVIVMFKKYSTHYQNLGVTFEIGKAWQICMWLTILLNIIIFIFIEAEKKYRLSLLNEFQQQQQVIPIVAPRFNYGHPQPPAPPPPPPLVYGPNGGSHPYSSMPAPPHPNYV